jgi:hypothetical protein
VLRPDIAARVVLIRGDAEVASWPLARTGPPDLSLVEELARLQLAARRRGCSIRLRGACAELSELLDFVGLRGAVGDEPGGGEQPVVREVVVPDDPLS